MNKRNLISKLLVFCVFGLWATSLQSQNQRAIDSLKEIVESSSDTTRYTALSYLVEEYVYNDPATGLKYIHAALDYAREIGYKKGEAISLIDLGLYYKRKGECDRALEEYKKAQEVYAGYGDLEGVGIVLHNRGVCNNMLGEFEQALLCYERALKIWEELGKDAKRALTLGNIGTINFSMKEYARARDYFLKEYAIEKDLNGSMSIYRTLMNIAGTDMMLGNYDEAIERMKESIAGRRRLGQENEVAEGLKNLATVLQKKDNHALALLQLDTAINMFRRAGYLPQLAEALNIQSTSLAKTGRGSEAIQALDTSLRITKEIRSLETRLKTYEAYVEVYELLGDDNKALFYYKRHSALKDSIFSDEKVQAFAAMETRYKAHLSETENEGLRMKNKLQEAELDRRNFLLAGIISGALLLLLLGGFLYFRKNALEKQRVAEFAARSAELQQQLLRSQMNPHFIFNAMNSIQSYIMQSDKKIANTYLSKFANLMRMVLENSTQATVSLEEELSALSLYIELEALRFEHRFRHEVKIDASIDPEEVVVPPLIVQPYVENAIHHGLLPKQAEGHLAISVSAEDDVLAISVKDDGIGRQGSREINARKEHRSLGMSITQSRLDFLNRERDDRISVKVSDIYDSNGTPEGTHVTIYIPLAT